MLVAGALALTSKNMRYKRLLLCLAVVLAAVCTIGLFIYGFANHTKAASVVMLVIIIAFAVFCMYKDDNIFPRL